MNFLAVDTSAEYLTVLAQVNGERFCVHKTDCAMKHSTLLMPTVDELLQKAGAKISDFDCFACVVGAGSFTGIRIGIATMKGFALATGKPTVAITSFDLAAYIVKEDKFAVVLDALHGSYYACAYEKGECVLPPSYLTDEELAPWFTKGFTPVSYARLPLSNLQTFSPADGLFAAVNAKIEKQQFGELAALYIRKSQAELNREKGEI